MLIMRLVQVLGRGVLYINKFCVENRRRPKGRRLFSTKLLFALPPQKGTLRI